jgi:hypothetical protein
MKKEKEITPEKFLMAPTDTGIVQWDDVEYCDTLEQAVHIGTEYIVGSAGYSIYIYKLVKVLDLEVKTTDVK